MTGSYDLTLVFASFCVAVMAGYAGLDLGARLSHFEGRRQRLWLVGSAIAMGTGVWSMHFVGMRSFRLPVEITYDVWITGISWLASVGVALVAMFIISRSRLDIAGISGGGVMMGFGICLMHYSGMAAMRMQPGIVYDPAKVAASLLVSSVASAAALFICFNLRRLPASGRLPTKIAAAFIMGGAICSMHYIGMSAARFAPNSFCAPDNLLAGDWMGFPAALIGSGIVVTIMLLALLDSRVIAERQRLNRAHAEVERVYRLAYFDAATGLPNRAHFNDHLSRYMVRPDGSHPAAFGLVYAELRSHRAIVEHLGKDRFGDVLKTLSSQFSKVTRDGDLMARVSEEGFLFMVLDRPDRNLTVAMNALCAVLSTAVHHRGEQFKFIWNMGSSHFPQAGASPQSLIRAAMKPQRQIGCESATGAISTSRRYDDAVQMGVTA